MENKVTTRESLKKLSEALQQDEFKKEFNKLFISYINTKNTDKNAHYHAILKLLVDNGFDKHEAEHVFKQLRVKNSELIQNIQEIQKKREELDRNWNDKKWKLLANPLDIKTFAQLALETINDINLAFKQMQQQMQLNNANNKVFNEKIDEIKKLIYDTELDLKELIEHDPENTFTLHDAVKNIQKIADKAEELTADVVTKNMENIDIKGQQGKEKTENPQAPAAAEKETERSESPEQKDAYMLSDAIYKAELELNTPNDRFNEPDYKEKLAYLSLLIHAMDKHHISDDIWTGIYSRNFDVDFLKKNAELTIQTYNLHDAFNKINNDIKRNTDDILIEDNAAPTESASDLTLDKALENSLGATMNSLNEKVDEKTLSFLTLSEYLHAYNNFPLNEVYAKFDKIFDKDEFKAIVLYNNALMDNATDDIFDFAVEEGYEAVNIGEYAKMLKRNFPEYNELDKELEKELEPQQQQKELEIGAPQRNKKFKTLEI